MTINYNYIPVGTTISNNLGDIKKGDKKDFTKKVQIKDDLKLPIKKNTELGVVKVYRGDELVGESKIINTEDINKASYLQMLRRIVDNLL